MTRTFVLFVSILCWSCENRNKSSAASDWPKTFGFGREATTEEIALRDIDVGPDGAGLLHEGKGIASAGAIIYQQKCSTCHGKDGTDGPYGALVTDRNDTTNTKKTVGNYWPYATTLYDYIHRAMPFDKPGSLTPQEVYDLTAFILYSNHVIDSTFVVDYKTLPGIVMPAHAMFVPDDRKGGAEIR